jgi:hypothetical protein
VSFPASPVSNRNLVIAKLRGSNQTVVRDVTDIDNPLTVAVTDWPGGWGSDGLGSPSFVSPSTISYSTDSRNLMRLTMPGSGPESVVAACGYDSIVAFRWSPDGRSFTYLLEDSDLANPAHAFQWHLASGGVDRVIGTAPVWCHCGAGSIDNSLAVAFSPNGQFVSLVDFMQRGTSLQVRRLDGSLVGAEIRGEPNSPDMATWGVWSGTDLFYRDKAGVERWREGAAKQFLPGVAWTHPWASPTGDQMVYAVQGRDGLSHVSVVDTTNGRARLLSTAPRAAPVFLTPRYVWYVGERACGPNEPGICLGTTYSGKTYVYDLQTGTEWESVITAVADVWPHGA